MTSQEFYEFQTTVEGSAKSFVNLPNGDAVVTCEDGVKLLVLEDGDSELVLPIFSASNEGDAVIVLSRTTLPACQCIYQDSLVDGFHVTGSGECPYEAK